MKIHEYQAKELLGAYGAPVPPGEVAATVEQAAAAAEKYGLGYDLIAGNDIAGFKRIAEAMIAQGL